MSNEALTWAFKLNVPSTPKFVLIAMADYADEEQSCYPSVRRLMERTSLSESAVKAALRKLAEWKLITAEARERTNGSTASNRYRLNVGGAPEIPEGAPRDPGGAPHAGEGASENPPGGASENPLEPSLSIPQSTITRTPAREARVTPSTTEVNRAWEAFWRVYPRKVGKPKAYEAFKRAMRRASAQDIVAGAIGYRDDPNREDAFTAHPTTWINRDGWNDGPLPAPAPRRGSAEEALRTAARLDAEDAARNAAAGGYNWDEAAKRKELGA